MRGRTLSGHFLIFRQKVSGFRCKSLILGADTFFPDTFTVLCPERDQLITVNRCASIAYRGGQSVRTPVCFGRRTQPPSLEGAVRPDAEKKKGEHGKAKDAHLKHLYARAYWALTWLAAKGAIMSQYARASWGFSKRGMNREATMWGKNAPGNFVSGRRDLERPQPALHPL